MWVSETSTFARLPCARLRQSVFSISCSPAFRVHRHALHCSAPSAPSAAPPGPPAPPGCGPARRSGRRGAPAAPAGDGEGRAARGSRQHGEQVGNDAQGRLIVQPRSIWILPAILTQERVCRNAHDGCQEHGWSTGTLTCSRCASCLCASASPRARPSSASASLARRAATCHGGRRAGIR